MTEEQNKQIINYLISKKLPIDVLVEIYDHFVSQIYDLENEMQFDEAFEKAKKSWSKDLGFEQDAFTGLEGTRFVNKLNWQIQKSYLLKGLKLAWIPFLLLGFLAMILPLNLFEYSFYACIGLYVVSLIYLMVKQYKQLRKLTQKYDNYTLSIYRSQTFFIGMIGGILPQVAFNAEYIFEMFHNIFTFNFSWISMLVFVITFLVLAITPILFFNYKDLQNSYQKIQPFLQYLTPNRFYLD